MTDKKELEDALKKILKEEFKFFIAPTHQKQEFIIISPCFHSMPYPLRHEMIERGLRLAGIWDKLPPFHFVFFSPEEWSQESKLDT